MPSDDKPPFEDPTDELLFRVAALERQVRLLARLHNLDDVKPLFPNDPRAVHDQTCPQFYSEAYDDPALGPPCTCKVGGMFDAG